MFDGGLYELTVTGADGATFSPSFLCSGYRSAHCHAGLYLTDGAQSVAIHRTGKERNEVGTLFRKGAHVRTYNAV